VGAESFQLEVITGIGYKSSDIECQKMRTAIGKQDARVPLLRSEWHAIHSWLAGLQRRKAAAAVGMECAEYWENGQEKGLSNGG
jgi:hypothetical protein